MIEEYIYDDNLSSERLVTRFLTEGDATAWSEFFKDKEATELFPETFLSAGAEQTSGFWIDRQITRYDNKNFGLQALIDKSTQELIGQCGLLRQEVDKKEEVEVGYHILRKNWKKGYATEAAKLFIDYAFKNNITNSVVSIIDVRNVRSQRVAERNGLIRDRSTKWNGLDVYIYRINKPAEL